MADTAKGDNNGVTDDRHEEDWQIQRDEYKAVGDEAYRVRAYKTAIDEYTKAISLDPELVVLYSNRSAAYLSNSETSKALRDAQKCVELDWTFMKGHSRLAAALFALRRYDAAADSYRQVLEHDTSNVAARRGLEACEKELQKIADHQLRQEQEEDEFMSTASTNGDTKSTRKAAQTAAQEERQSGTKDGKESGDSGDEDDDLLADFFDEVDEVVNNNKKTKEEVATPQATNSIRNDREALGSAREQVDRLLQTRYEWRNLNPYFVLQLPAATSTDEDISRRYKAMSLLLHPDKNQAQWTTKAERDRVQLAYDQVQKAKVVLTDPDRRKYIQSLVAEGLKQGEWKWTRSQKAHKLLQKGKTYNPHTSNLNENEGVGADAETLEEVQDREVMRIFAQVEQKRREVEERERNYEQRERQQEDDAQEKERQARQFDKKWRDEERVGKRVGNWRDFSSNNDGKKRPKA
jgi:DnaJ family protein C protein 8